MEARLTADPVDIRVKVADYAVSGDGTISTIGLGSCVAIVLHDSVAQVGGMAQTKLRGVKRVQWMFVFRAAAYNLIRLPRLLATG